MSASLSQFLRVLFNDFLTEVLLLGLVWERGSQKPSMPLFLNCESMQMLMVCATTSLVNMERCQGRNSSRAGTQMQSLMQRPQRGTVYWLAPHALLNLLSYRIQDHQPRDGPTHDELGPLPSITN